MERKWDAANNPISSNFPLTDYKNPTEPQKPLPPTTMVHAAGPTAPNPY